MAVKTMERPLGSMAWARVKSASSRGRERMSHEFQRRKRPTYTPTAVSAVTKATKPQPTQRPNSRRMISCIMNSETMPSSNPVKANQTSINTSYQVSMSCQLATARCCRSVRM